MGPGGVGGEYEQRFEHTVGADGTHQLVELAEASTRISRVGRQSIRGQPTQLRCGASGSVRFGLIGSGFDGHGLSFVVVRPLVNVAIHAMSGVGEYTPV